MEVRDYYSILQVPPSASIQDIKKAYRKLAMQWHPDKNGNDKYAAVQFNLIKEAYETLTNPVKKDQYLQQRWYQKSTGRAFSTNEALTPDLILAQTLELNRYVARLDIFRIDQEGLSKYIHWILSDTNLQLLEQFREEAANNQIVLSMADSCKVLNLPYLLPIIERLKKIKTGEDLTPIFKQLIGKEKRRRLWESYQLVTALIITIIICLVIFFAGK